MTIDYITTFESMEPRIETLAPKMMAGHSNTMSFSADKTYELWNGFMPHRKEITNPANTNLYAIGVYEEGFFNNFDTAREFELWAAAEVIDDANVPAGMKILPIPTGQYAVFTHIGPASTAPIILEYIFSNWLPNNSNYLLDTRPHLAIMTEKYQHNDPNAEEEFWIPVKLRQ